ncbi:PQQ-dependent sugar dehydrogenase [Palleronia sp. KMU-117]|uniref:PQQ-dependent sugar dehydrogenase n=1 Tax=Palleronia sp. KMU-117 TaxID=3434108 RepID=UPI003D75228D
MPHSLTARLILMLSLVLPAGVPDPATALQTSAGRVSIAPVASGLTEPWGLAFLPGGEAGGGALVTERDGRLLLLRDGRATPVAGLPEVAASGQGGLLDVMVPRDFAQTREVFLSFAQPQAGGAGTALAVGRLSQDGGRLEDLRVIFEMTGGNSGGRHFGSRIVEAPDGTIFLTIGDRGDGMLAQVLSRHNGSVLRLNRDGSVPADNPFVDVAGARPEIWSYGHRNPQGAALDLQGNLWIHEHGARGGDEVNRIRRGANYGWPVISYGRHYSGGRIGEGTEKPGMEQPAFYWDPSIAPSGMLFYSGRLWPEWRGDIFVGSLNSDLVIRLDGETVREAERWDSPETTRVRDIREAPDGSIWFLSVGEGAIYRMTPG